MLLVGPIVLLGLVDMLQSKQTIRRNFPVIGHARYLMEMVRPEIQQYFIENNIEGRPFNREERSLIYQRAKGAVDSLPFGTQRDVYETGYEWINHSMMPVEPKEHEPRVWFGQGRCAKPYSASIFNVSAMSYGALSSAAIMSLNRAAKEGGFSHNTGEGSISPAHMQGGDLVWQVGTGYFGCRTPDGRFDPGSFADKADRDEVKMIEVKISQGAKPGHGGILPAKKITKEIAEIRGVVMGKDVNSPPAHTAFTTPIGLLEFVTQLRELSGGKPVGFKLCIGKRREFLAVCKAMLETGMVPDFITIDGGEGGTGAAPFEFSNSLGTPLLEGLTFAHNALVGIGLRESDPHRRLGQGLERLHAGAHHRPRRRHLQRGAPDDARDGLHPGAQVQHERVSRRHRDPESGADGRPRARGEVEARRALPPRDDPRGGGPDERGGPLGAVGAAALARHAAGLAARGAPLRRDLRVPGAGRAAARRPAGEPRPGLGGGGRFDVRPSGAGARRCTSG